MTTSCPWNVAYSIPAADFLDIQSHKILILKGKTEQANVLRGIDKSIEISIPGITLNKELLYNSQSLTQLLKNNLEHLKSAEIYQYSLDPAEARLKLTFNQLVAPTITIKNQEKTVIEFEPILLKDIVKPVLKAKPVEEMPVACSFMSIKSTSNQLKQPVKEAIERLSNRQTAKGKQELITFLTKEPEDRWANYYLAKLYIQEREFELANKLLNKATANGEDFFGYYYLLGLVNKEQEKYTEAINHLNKAIEEYPEHTDALFQLGIIYLSQDDIENARNYFAKVLFIEPEHQGAQVNLGLISLKNNETDKSQTYFSQSLRPDSLNNLGNLYLSKNENDLAINAFALAYHLDDSNAIYAYNLAKSYYLSDNHHKAIDFYEKAITLDPTMSIAAYNLAIIYASMEKTNLAVKYFKQYLHLAPNAEDASEITHLIEKLEK